MNLTHTSLTPRLEWQREDCRHGTDRPSRASETDACAFASISLPTASTSQAVSHRARAMVMMALTQYLHPDT